jgi:hypothetical protein
LNSNRTDASEKFWQFHSKTVLEKIATKFKIGNLVDVGGGGGGGVNSVDSDSSSSSSSQSNSIDNDGKADEEAAEADEDELDELDETYFGDLVPFGGKKLYTLSLSSLVSRLSLYIQKHVFLNLHEKKIASN